MPWMRSITITSTRHSPSRPPARRAASSQRSCAQLCGVGGLAHQVELVEDGLLVLGDDRHRRSRRVVPDQRSGKPASACSTSRSRSIRRAHAGPQHLHDDVIAAVQARGMHLRDRGGGQRLWSRSWRTAGRSGLP
jgi:hypothetical protein